MRKGVLCCKKILSTDSVESNLLSKIPVWIIAKKYDMVLLYVKRVFHKKVHHLAGGCLSVSAWIYEV